MNRIAAVAVICVLSISQLFAQEPAPAGGGPANWMWYVLASGVVGIIIGYGIATAMWRGRMAWRRCNKICTQHGTYCDRDPDHEGMHHCPNGHDF